MMNINKIHKITLLIAMTACTLLLGAILGGCEEQGKTATDNETNKPATTQSSTQENKKETPKEELAKDISIMLYYPDEQGSKLVGVKYSLKDQADKYRLAIEALLSGTGNPQTWSIIPRRTKLRDIKVSNGLATVDFSKHIVKNFGGGSTGEEMLVGSIVNTLTEFPEIKKVKITVEGKSIETISGHMDLSATLERMTYLL